MAVLEDGQYEYRGLVFGFATAFGVDRVEGLEGIEVRTDTNDLPRGHGAVPGTHYATARYPLFALQVLADDLVHHDQLLAELRRTFSVVENGDLPLKWKRPGMPDRFVYARPSELPIVESQETWGRVATKATLVCADQRIYSADLHTETVNPFDPAGGGADWPVDGPKEFPAGASSEAVLTNAGASEAWPTLRFYGPRDGGTLTAVQLTNRTTGVMLAIDTNIGAGQVLAVDMRALVTGNGDLVVGIDGASRYGSWLHPRAPFGLAPGDNVLRLETTGTTQDAPCVVSYRDTWLG